MEDNINQIKPKHKKTKITLYVVLRLFVIIAMIAQAIRGNYANVFSCVLALILFLIPSIIDKKLNIELPNVLEGIILLFIFSALVLGEIQNFYGIFKYWDTILHTLNGFIMGGVGFALIDILNKSDKFHITLAPIFVALVAFCFSMTIGILWEFYEYASDTLLRTDMQKDTIITDISSVTLNIEGENVPIKLDNITNVGIYNDIDGVEEQYVVKGGYLDIGLVDTMEDLIVNCIGAIGFCIIGYEYISTRGKKNFAQNFIPKLKQTFKNTKKVK